MKLRPNPAYRLVPWAELPEARRRDLEPHVEAAQTFGLLTAAPGSGLPDKIVGRSGAAVFAGELQGLGETALTRLVLDGVLEMQRDGKWISGPLAGSFDADVPEAKDRLGHLAYAAVAHAARLPLGVEGLTTRLYGYNRQPVSRRWQNIFPDATAVLSYLETTDWQSVWHRPETNGRDWLTFGRRGLGERFPLPYKLYVSPHIADVPRVLPQVVQALGRTDVVSFKIGPDAAGLLRPDKFVVYLRDASELKAVAEALLPVLEGIRPHGVPFSAAIDDEGLLSWGGDPPQDSGPVGGGIESWRLSVCRRLAEHLVAGSRAGLTDPVRYALTRLAADGVRLPDFAPADLEAFR